MQDFRCLNIVVFAVLVEYDGKILPADQKLGVRNATRRFRGTEYEESGMFGICYAHAHTTPASLYAVL